MTGREFKKASTLLDFLALIELGGKLVAIQAVKNFRTLKALGFTWRMTIDTIIVTMLHRGWIHAAAL